jgi:hypothetical protein
MGEPAVGTFLVHVRGLAVFASSSKCQGSKPKSLLPGNGILPAETKAPKPLRKTKETIAETMLEICLSG